MLYIFRGEQSITTCIFGISNIPRGDELNLEQMVNVVAVTRQNRSYSHQIDELCKISARVIISTKLQVSWLSRSSAKYYAGRPVWRH